MKLPVVVCDSAVDLSAMTDSHHVHDLSAIIYGIDDAVRTLTDSIALILARKLLTSRRTWRLGEASNARHDSDADRGWTASSSFAADDLMVTL